jgi:hypothetical protein
MTHVAAGWPVYDLAEEIARSYGLHGIFVRHEVQLDPRRPRPTCDTLVILHLGDGDAPNRVPWSHNRHSDMEHSCGHDTWRADTAVTVRVLPTFSARDCGSSRVSAAGIRLRRAPSLASQTLRTLRWFEHVTLLCDPPVKADGYVWQRVIGARDAAPGWMAVNWVEFDHCQSFRPNTADRGCANTAAAALARLDSTPKTIGV